MRRTPEQRCKKVEVVKDGTAQLRCRDMNDEPAPWCSGIKYGDCAVPLPENMCISAIGNHVPHMNDPYKRTYTEACHLIDETLADPYKADSYANLQSRFEGIGGNLERMIDSDELHDRDLGRYLYHIDARMLHAFITAFWHRAEFGIDKDIPPEIINDVYEHVVKILEDFSGLYKDVHTQVALRRTEVEIFALLLRTGNPKFFPYPTLFREDASKTTEFNHDGYVISGGKKIPIQITNSDYISRKGPKRGKRKSSLYHPSALVAIHQTVVNLDQRSGETIITRVEGSPSMIDHEHDISEDPWDHYDEEQQLRYIAWGTFTPEDESEDFTGEYIQTFSSESRDGLIDALLKEARKETLTIEEMNQLNGASHYLMAAIREKQVV